MSTKLKYDRLLFQAMSFISATLLNLQENNTRHGPITFTHLNNTFSLFQKMYSSVFIVLKALGRILVSCSITLST